MVSTGGTREYEKHGLCVRMIYIVVIRYNNFLYEGVPKKLPENSYNFDRCTLSTYSYIF